MKLAPISQNPDYAAALAEMAKLSQALAKVRTRLEEISVLLSAPQISRNESATLSAALAFAETGIVQPSPFEVSNLNEERQALSEQEAALVRASARQREAQDLLVSELSEQLARDVQAAHGALAKRYLKLLQEADQILEEERQLVSNIESAGYHSRLPALILSPQLGRINDTTGSLAYYLHRDVSAIANS